MTSNVQLGPARCIHVPASKDAEVVDEVVDVAIRRRLGDEIAQRRIVI
jgi:hypothetical protein